MKRHTVLILSTAIANALAASAATAATITVNSAGDDALDDGTCTLREAIASASTNLASGVSSGECVAGDPLPTVDTIAFAIPGSGVQTIQPTNPMPSIAEAAIIDGYTQPGATPNTLAVGDNAVLKVELDGSLLTAFDDVLRVSGSGSTVRGLVFNRATAADIYVGFSSATDDTVVEGNFFNTDASGTTLLSNSTAIRITGSRNLVGGTTPAARNIIAGGENFGSAELMIGGDANAVKGNYVGLDASGTIPLQGQSGANAFNLGAQGAATNTVIGGDEPGAGNVIVAYSSGIVLNGGNVTGTTIEGNLIGTDATSTIALGGSVGISTHNGPAGILVGGTTSGAGNVFAGLNAGIYLVDGPTGVVIQGNHFGVDRTDSRALPNRGNAIVLHHPGLNGSIIGGTNAGEGNTIAYNCGAGVAFSFGPNHWPILGNRIYSNAGLGISFQGTPIDNDPGDGDTGANDLQNHPVITSAVVSGGTATISGTLNSTPTTTFRLEFFASEFCDATGYGEGQQFIGTTDVTTDDNGDASFGPLVFAAPDDTEITATATDPDGNTSEFSQCAGPHDHLFADDFDVANTCS